MIRRLASALLATVLAGCAVGQAPALAPDLVAAGHVDPEHVEASPVAAPGNCKRVHRATLPVEIDGLPMVPAEINGQAATLVLDTGAESAVLGIAAAKRLGVTTKYDFVRSLSGIGRAVPTGDARLRSMRLGGLALAYPRALVGDVALRIGEQEVDGLLGASLLGDYDLDIDIPRRRLELFDRQDCAGARPAWTGPYATLVTTRSLSQHPFFPITVDGRTLTVSLDTGAQRTVISSGAAARAGIGPGSQIEAGTQLARGAAGEVLPATLHAVDLRVAGMPLASPVLVTSAGLPPDIDGLLGLDFLLHHRVWLSYGARRLFIAPG